MKKGNNFMENLLTISEAAEKLKVAESTLRTWKRRGDIPSNCFLKLGTKIYLHKIRFKNYIEQSV